MLFPTLPNEIIFQVLSYLDYQSELNAVSQTSKSLHVLANKALYSQLPENISGFTLEHLVGNGNADALRLLIDHGVNINSVPRKSGIGNLTAYAATKGHFEIVRLLLDQDPCSIDSKDSPLLCALINENMPIAQLLISRGAKADSRDSMQRLALSYAAGYGSLSAVRYLIEEMHFDVNEPTESTPLRESIENEKWDVAQYLLQAGANPMLDESEQTKPLLLEAGRKSCFDSSVVLSLLERIGMPNLDASPYWRDMALHGKDMIPLIMEKLDLSAAVEEYDTYLCLLVLATAAGNEGVLRHILDTNSLVLSKDSFTRHLALDELSDNAPCPWLPLHWAVKNEHIGCVDILLDLYSSPLSPEQLKELISRTSLGAIKHRRYLLARHLLCKHPDDTIKLQHIRQPGHVNEAYSQLVLDCGIYHEASHGIMKGRLSSACAGGNASAVKIWLEILERRGIETRLRKTCDDELDYEVNQLFESVAHFCNFETFNVLLEHMNVELCPSSLTHQQMLCNFVRSGETEVVRLFLDRGFDVNVMHCDEQENMSSLLVKAASSAGADEEVEAMVQLLLDRGALADAIDHTRITALTHATERQTLGVINMLLDRGANPIFGLGEMITPLEMAAREFQSDLLRKFLDVMITRKLKFDNILSLLPSRRDDSVVWTVDTAKALTQYHWRCMYPV
ncbi:hypothetical protein N7467_005650 [Penicillium canescens]|nr:hypothetical protein N7467_005650 [Penicillium canescens]